MKTTNNLYLLFILFLAINSYSFAQTPPPNFAFTASTSAGALYGQAQINSVPASTGDWLAAFDPAGNCAGANEVIMSGGIAYINLTIYGNDPATTIDEGVDSFISGNEGFTLQLYDVSAGAYYDYPSTPANLFTQWANYNGAAIPAYNNSNDIYNFMPPIVADAGPNTTICEGDIHQLNATGGITCAWATAQTGLSSYSICNPMANPTVTTTYNVTITDNMGASAPATVTITVDPMPTANAGTPQTICTGDAIALNATGGTSYQWSNNPGLSNYNTANPIAFPTTTTIYTVTVTDGNTCTSTDNLTITVNPLPIITLTPNTTICAGQSVQLNATGGNTYLWSPVPGLDNYNVANPIASPTTTTVYSVIIIDGITGCEEYGEVTVTVDCMVLDLRVYLESAYVGSGLMNTTLNSLLPTNQPFNTAPWNYNDGGAQSSVTVPPNAVDWVLVEIRDAVNTTTIVEQKAAFLLENGAIVDVNSGNVSFNNLTNGNGYYVIIRSRNHLDVMSRNSIIPSGNFATYDFTTAVTQVAGNAQQVVMVDAGVYALNAGDIDGNGIISVEDFNEYETQLNTGATVNIYANTDVDLNSNLTINDFNTYKNNASLFGIQAIRY